MNTPQPSKQPLLLFVVSGLGRGGTERHLLQLLPMLAARGFTPLVFSLAGKGPMAGELEAAGIEVVAPGSATWSQSKPRFVRWVMAPLVAAVTLASVLVRRRPSLVHFFLPAAYIIGGLVCLVVGPKLRVMSRRSLNDYQSGKKLAGSIERILHKRMSAVLGNSRAVVSQLRAEGVPPARLGLIYNGIALPEANRRPAPSPPVGEGWGGGDGSDRAEHFAIKIGNVGIPPTPSPQGGGESRAALRTRLGIAPDELVLIKVANLIPYKGHQDLIDALGRIKDRLPAGWRLLIVGRDDGIGDALRRRSSELGLASNLIWLGERRDVAELYAASDIGLLCSHEEGFANAILEGMAAALPMVVTDVGGNGEAVLDGVTGLVVPARDPDALARAILSLALDAGQRRAFGDASRARVVAEFSLERMAGAYAELYAALLAGKALPIGRDGRIGDA